MNRWLTRKTLTGYTLLLMAGVASFFFYNGFISGRSSDGLVAFIGVWPIAALLGIFFAVLATAWVYLFSSKSSSSLARDRFGLFAYVVLVASLFLSLLVFHYFREHQKLYSATAFDAECRRVTGLVGERFNLYVDTLSAIQGFFAASKSVEADEWEEFVSKLHISQRNVGIEAVRYFEVISDGSYALRYFSALNRDFYEHPSNEALEEQRRAVELARDTGQAAMTSRLILRKEDGRNGFMIVSPIYKNGEPLETVDQRRRAHKGFIDAVCSAEEFFTAMIDQSGLKGIQMEIHDGDELVSSYGGLSILFDSAGSNASEVRSGGLSVAIPLFLAKRVWTVKFQGDEDYGLGPVEKRFAGIILFGGCLFSLLMFGILLTFSAARKRAVDIARIMTLDLRNLAVIVEQSDDAIISYNLEGIITSWNKGAEKVYGWKEEEIKGQSIQVLFPDHLKFELKEILERVQHGGHLQHHRTVRIRKDGSEAQVSLTVSAIRDAQGVVIGASVIARDVTQFKEAEDAIEKARLEQKAILDNIPDIAWLKDKDSRYIAVNEACGKAAGAFPEQMIGKNDFDFWPTDLAEKYRADDEEVMRSSKRKKMEEEFQGSNGSRTWIETIKTPIYSTDGKVIGTTGIARDITERKRLETQILQTQKMDMIGTMAGGIAHDLNNQLTPVVGYIDLLLKQLTADPLSTELLTDAKMAAGRCVDVVSRLLAFSHTSTQTISLLSPSQTLVELKKLLTRVFPATISIEIDCPSDVWIIKANETELQTVFMNLATNAKDAMAGGGKLKVSAVNIAGEPGGQPGEKNGPKVLFVIKDSGMGIPRENLLRIFEPFFTTKERGRGTGLGLAMVFSIIKKYGGWIEVNSQLGEGTEFRILLPAQIGAVLDSDAPKKATGFMPKGSETILFADDEDNLRKLGRVFLERLGYKVLMASDGEEAVKIYREKMNEIGAVVMDITMPRLSGSQALDQIRLLNPNAKVILASGYSSEGSSKDFIVKGAYAFLHKPYTIQPLAQTLRQVLDQ